MAPRTLPKVTKNECSAPKPASNCPALIAAAQQNVTSALAALGKTSATAKTAKAAVTAAQAQLKSAQDAYQAANTATLAEIKEMQACPSCLSVQNPLRLVPCASRQGLQQSSLAHLQATIDACVAAKKAAVAFYVRQHTCPFFACLLCCLVVFRSTMPALLTRTLL